MKLLLLNHPYTSQFLKQLEAFQKDCPDFSFEQEGSDEDRLKLIENADGIVLGRLRPGDLEHAKKLKIIFVPWAGVNHLPWDLIRERNIQVAHTHGNARPVAEKAFQLCLALLGHVVVYHKDMQKGRWHGFAAGQFEDRWQTLQNRSCGILGFGSIGKNLLTYLLPFQGPFHALKKHPPAILPEGLSSCTSDIDEIIDKSNVLFLTMPTTPETKKIISQDRLKRMQGKYLINVSRGELIDEKALYEALTEGSLAGAAMDVWFQYPRQRNEIILPSIFPFHELDNVVMSPHVGGFCEEGHQLMIQETLQNIEAWLNTGKAKFLADAILEY
jgi:phosphoglycerate dehydrogenase-like enzyme